MSSAVCAACSRASRERSQSRPAPGGSVPRAPQGGPDVEALARHSPPARLARPVDAPRLPSRAFLHLNGGGAEGRRPRLQFDHVQVAVGGLDAAAEHFASRYGLMALQGGHHPGRGTGNMIVPLGRSYLELIAVVEESEAESFPTSRRVRRALDS